MAAHTKRRVCIPYGRGVATTHLHGQRSRLLVIVMEEIGHKGGVVRQILAHSQSDWLTAELTVALCGLHVNAQSRGAQEERHGAGD